MYTRTHAPHNTVMDKPSVKPTTPAEESETSLVPKSSASTEETERGARPSDITVPDTNLASRTSSGNSDTIASNMEVDPLQSGGQDMDLAGASSGDDDIIGSNMEVDRPQSSIDLAVGASSGDGDAINMEVDRESSSQDMDIDTVPFDDVSNRAGNSIQNLNGQNFEAASDTIAQEDKGENSDTVATQGEHVVKEAQAVVMTPAKPTPIRYLDGKRVSEYEWERSEKIKENSQLLTKLGLNDTGKQLFGKKQGKKGKENRGIEDRPLKPKRQNTRAGAGQRKLRSSAKVVPNTSVSIVINTGLTADLSVVLM
jgi:hypothetical protein